jgi:multidrug resistance efflux pump
MVPQGPPSSGLFREKAVTSIDSVERFDEAIVVVSSRSALALAMIGALVIGVVIWAIFGHVPVGLEGRGVIVTGSGVQPVIAGEAGTVIDLPVQPGDAVAQGQAIVRMRTVGGRIVALRAPGAGVLAQRSPQIGSFLRNGDTVAVIEPAGAVPAAVIFVPVETDRRAAVGMPVNVSPADASPDIFGYLRGHVTYVAPLPASPDRIKAALENDAVASSFSSDVPVREVHVALDVDAQGNLVWSGLQNARRELAVDTPCNATVVVEERHPISFLLPRRQ